MIDTGNWRKSSYSGGHSDNCVEVASGGDVLIRDTTNRNGATLNVTASAWLTFTSTIK